MVSNLFGPLWSGYSSSIPVVSAFSSLLMDKMFNEEKAETTGIDDEFPLHKGPNKFDSMGPQERYDARCALKLRAWKVEMISSVVRGSSESTFSGKIIVH